MRELKFKAWNKKNKLMRFVEEIVFPYQLGKSNLGNRIIVWDHESREAGIIKGRTDTWSINDVELMQFTGLKDKNGVEIYEGDILKYLAHYPIDYQNRNPLKKFGRVAGPVVWEKGWLWLDYRPEKDDGTLLYESEAENWEVIGNIWANPELLTTK